jgi:hypothetical protein
LIEQSTDRGVIDLLDPEMSKQKEPSEIKTIESIDSYEMNSINEAIDIFTLGVKN